MSQSIQAQPRGLDTERVEISGTQLTVSRVALGTWAMGGWMWGGTDERESVATIHAALDQGINLIDTAPVYGFGVSEEIVGKPLDGHARSEAVIATKVGPGMARRQDLSQCDAARESCRRSMIRCAVCVPITSISIRCIGPIPLVPIEETAEAMRSLYEQGKIRADRRQQFLGCPDAALPRSRPAARAAVRRTTCSSARSKRRFCPTAAPTASRRSAMAHSVEDC